MKSDFGSCPQPLCRFSSSRVGVGSLHPSSFSALLPGNPWRTARRSFQNLPGLLRIAHGKNNQLLLRASSAPVWPWLILMPAFPSLPAASASVPGLLAKMTPTTSSSENRKLRPVTVFAALAGLSVTSRTRLCPSASSVMKARMFTLALPKASGHGRQRSWLLLHPNRQFPKFCHRAPP
jgi:hypothetical protein